MDIIKKIVKILLAAFVLWIVAILTTLFASMVNIAFIWIIALIIDIALFLFLIIYILSQKRYSDKTSSNDTKSAA